MELAILATIKPSTSTTLLQYMWKLAVCTGSRYPIVSRIAVKSDQTPPLKELKMMLTSMRRDYNVDNELAIAMMYIMGLLSSMWSVTIATDGAGCGDPESFLRYRKIEPSNFTYSEPLISTTKATFGMGCFWGVEASFGALPGVVRVKAGYTGGNLDNPNYRRLGDHTEAVEIEFDPTKTSYGELLKVFYQDHDPTELYKAQYMSAIFYHDGVQRHQAEASLQAEQKKLGEALQLVTKILSAGKFYAAEDYHQKYFLRQQHALVESLHLKDADFLSSSRTSRLLGYMSGPGTVEGFNAEVENLALSPSQADFMRVLIENKDGSMCH